MTLARDSEGRAQAEITIIGKRTTKLGFDLIVQGARFVTLASSASGITVEGRWRDEVIDGQFRQGPFEAPLTLKRIVAWSQR